MHQVFAAALAFFSLSVLANGPQSPSSAPKTEPVVSLPGRARVGDVIRELNQQLPGVCVADAALSGRIMSQPSNEVPLSALLPRISRELDRFWLRKNQVLVLQRRFSNPDDDPELELEEVKATTADLFRLMSPFVRERLGKQHIQDKNDFVDSLSPAQQRAMVDGGLTLAQLPDAQRNAWLEINLAHAYASAHYEVERAARCLETWDRNTLRDLQLNNQRRQDYGVTISHPSIDNGSGFCRLYVPGAGRSAAEIPEGLDLPANPIALPADLKPTWDLPAEELSLGQLVDRLEQAGGPRVRVPEYARERRLWIGSKSGTRAEVLDAVGLLWGWDLTPHPNGGYLLARPRFVAARNPQELHARMLRAVPPALLHHLRAQARGDTMRLPRQMALVADAVARIAGRDWTSIPVNKLDAMTQKRLANCIAVAQLGDWFTNHGREPNAPAWLTNPERGVLTLGGPVTANSHPLLKFSVFREEGKIRTEEFWGWYVNTSSLPSRQNRLKP